MFDTDSLNKKPAPKSYIITVIVIMIVLALYLIIGHIDTGEYEDEIESQTKIEQSIESVSYDSHTLILFL